MPIYEYGCSSCGHALEALQKLNDKPLRKCPECGRQTLKRLMSAPAFRLKGGGWYETDFKSDKEKKRNLADGGGEKAKDDSGGKEAAKADDKKPASKTEPVSKEAKSSKKAGGKRTGSEAA